MRETRFTTLLIFLSVFISSITFFNEPFEGYFHYLIFAVLLPSFLVRYQWPGKITVPLLLLLLSGVFQIVIGNNTWPLFLKIFGGVVLSVSFYSYVLQYFKMDLSRIFDLYMKGVVIVCYIGLFQFASYILHFRFGYNYSWIFNKWGVVQNGFGIRINSVFSEASQCGIVIAPGCFIAIYNLISGNKRFGLSRLNSIAILVTMILTTSTTGYLGLFLAMILLIINYRRLAYLFFGTLLIIGGAYILYNNVEEFKVRVDTTMGLWVNEEYSLENINSSSFVLYNNFHIATENFKSNFLTGSGLGSHPIAFDQYTLTKEDVLLDIHFNKADGNSMLIRLISETGLMGVLFIFILIGRFFVRKPMFKEEENDLWLISNACLVIIILYLLRQGNYFLNGFPLFLWIYYYAGKQNKEGLPYDEEEDEEEEEEEEERKDIGSVRPE